jgi:hypothetical protein
MNLVWQYVDTYLSKIKGIQMLFTDNGAPAVYSIYLYNYVEVIDKLDMTKKLTKTDAGVD